MGLQGSQQPRTQGFVLLAWTQFSMVGSFTRYLEFSSKWNEDIEQHWYLCEAIWRARQMPNNMKLIDFEKNLREWALWWFIKWAELHQNWIVDEIKRSFVQEFKLPRWINKGLSEFWEIKQQEGETT